MLPSRTAPLWASWLGCCFPGALLSQSETALLTPDMHVVSGDATTDGTEPIEMYEPLNAALGGDSIRSCDGRGCTGWVEEHYPGGVLKKRGYYKDGQLLVYRNYHPSGLLEREFKVVDNTKCLPRNYHDNGQVRSEVHYVNGDALHYSDFYPNGRLRYGEVKHPDDPYYKVMDLFAEDRTPISTLRIVDKKKVVFEQKEYWPNGNVKSAGRSRFDPRRYDSRRIGEWISYGEDGHAVKKEAYIDGKVHASTDL